MAISSLVLPLRDRRSAYAPEDFRRGPVLTLSNPWLMKRFFTNYNKGRRGRRLFGAARGR